MPPTETALLTEPEIAAFKAAMANFGTCQCGTIQPTQHGPVKIQTCAGHLFLLETDRACSRIQRLVYVRRTLEAWQRAEQVGPCKQCERVAYHIVGKDVCEDCSTTDLIGQALPHLPW